MVWLLVLGAMVQEAAAESLLEYGKRAAASLQVTAISDLEQARTELDAIRSNAKLGLGGSGRFTQDAGGLRFEVQDRATQRKRMEEWQAKVRELQAAADNAPGWKLPRLPMPPTVNGSVGLSWGPDIEPGKTWCKVVQVTGPAEVIATIYGEVCIVRGVAAGDLTDEAGFFIPAETPVRISKTTYATAIGGTKTVFVVETFAAELEAFLGSEEFKAIPNRPAAGSRDWTLKDGSRVAAAVCVELEKGVVSLRLEDGSPRDIRLSELSPADQRAVQRWKNP